MRYEGLTIIDGAIFPVFKHIITHVPLFDPHNTRKKAKTHFNFREMMSRGYVSCPMSHGFK